MIYKRSEYDVLKKVASELLERSAVRPRVAIVLGSGLGEIGDEISDGTVIPYSEIKCFPTSGVDGHKGRLIFGTLEGTPVVIMQGRVHYYEGYSMGEVTYPIKLMKLLGVDSVILTNAAGGINSALSSGKLMLITDHISTFVESPLRGWNDERMGKRFPDMSEVYSKSLLDLARRAGEDVGISLLEGVYIQLPGPAYETPVEIRMCRALGADAVGMSTACEATVASYLGMKVLGISCVTNMAAGISASPLSHEEVTQTAKRVSSDFKRLIRKIIQNID